MVEEGREGAEKKNRREGKKGTQRVEKEDYLQVNNQRKVRTKVDKKR